jgi:hypothetical protein
LKRSGRDESIRVVIHIYIEAMLEISLYSYPYVKIAKMVCLSYFAYVFSSTKLEKRGTREGWGVGGRIAQTMYEHMNK